MTIFINPVADDLPEGALPALADISTADASADDAAAFARLAALSPIEYDRCRESQAKELGIRSSTLDSEVKSLRGEPEHGIDSVGLADPEPWPETVDGGDLLAALTATVEKYVVLPPDAAEAVALWIVHAHAHDTTAISPILAVTSPTPACGKTTLLTLLQALVPRPLSASNFTTAAVFRSIEKWRPTLLVDEADTFLRDNDALRGILNSGHNKSAAFVIRTAGENFEPCRFRTWAPKVIALIGKLHATLESRAIHIELRRMAEGEHVERLRGDRLEHLEPLCRMARRWASDNVDRLANTDPNMSSLPSGRTADNWRHILAIADVAGGDWPERARQAAETLSAGRNAQTAGVMLLEDLRILFNERHNDRLSSKEIVTALGRMEDRPWSEWRADKPITARQLARLLEPFKIAPTKFRADGYTPGTRGYERSAVADAFERYLSHPQSATAPQVSELAILSESIPPHESDAVADEPALKAREHVDCGVVADCWEEDP